MTASLRHGMQDSFPLLDKMPFKARTAFRRAVPVSKALPRHPFPRCVAKRLCSFASQCHGLCHTHGEAEMPGKPQQATGAPPTAAGSPAAAGTPCWAGKWVDITTASYRNGSGRLQLLLLSRRVWVTYSEVN